MSVAFAPERDAAATSAALAGLGLHPTAPRALGRALELPEGDVIPRFSLVNLPPEETPGLDCFICGHLTPELVRRPEWLRHANGVTGIKAVHFLVDNPAPLAPAYRRLFGKGRIVETKDRVVADTGRNALSFTTPAAFRAAYPGFAVLADFSMPGIVALEFTVESRAKTAACLKQARVAFDELPHGRLAIPADDANGAGLILMEG